MRYKLVWKFKPSQICGRQLTAEQEACKKQTIKALFLGLIFEINKIN
jgi:hypothetical protein